MKPWLLYMIQCADKSIYTGIAVNVAARFEVHKPGKGARYTRSRLPVRVIACIEYVVRSTALKAEYRVKQMTAAEKRNFVGSQAMAGSYPAVA